MLPTGCPELPSGGGCSSKAAGFAIFQAVLKSCGPFKVKYRADRQLSLPVPHLLQSSCRTHCATARPLGVVMGESPKLGPPALPSPPPPPEQIQAGSQHPFHPTRCDAQVTCGDKPRLAQPGIPGAAALLLALASPPSCMARQSSSSASCCCHPRLLGCLAALCKSWHKGRLPLLLWQYQAGASSPTGKCPF